MQNIIDRIEAIERTICEIDEMGRFMLPLVKLLLPIAMVICQVGN